MTTFETNTKVVHNSLVQNLHQRSIISFISNCFFSLDGSSSLKKSSSQLNLPADYTNFHIPVKKPGTPLEVCNFDHFMAQDLYVFFSGTNRNCDHSCGWAELWEVLHHTQCWIPHEMEGIVHATDYLNYFHKKILFPGRTYRTSKWWQCLASGIKWFPDMDTRPLYLQPEKYQHQVFANCPLPPIIQR